MITRPVEQNGLSHGGTGGTSGAPQEIQHILRSTLVPPAREKWDKTGSPDADCPTCPNEVGQGGNAKGPAKQGLSHLSHVSHQDSNHAANALANRLDPTAMPRQAEVSHAWADAFARLSRQYPDSLLGSLWNEVNTVLPHLASAIDTAERAADVAALDYQAGRIVLPSVFHVALADWEEAWAGAMATLATARSSRACHDCGRTDATVKVTTTTGQYCRRCLRGG